MRITVNVSELLQFAEFLRQVLSASLQVLSRVRMPMSGIF